MREIVHDHLGLRYINTLRAWRTPRRNVSDLLAKYKLHTLTSTRSRSPDHSVLLLTFSVTRTVDRMMSEEISDTNQVRFATGRRTFYFDKSQRTSRTMMCGEPTSPSRLLAHAPTCPGRPLYQLSIPPPPQGRAHLKRCQDFFRPFLEWNSLPPSTVAGEPSLHGFKQRVAAH